MSHTVTVTRTTTTSTTSAILLNIGYFKTIPGILKLLHVILGVICVSLVGHYIAYHKNQYVYRSGANYPHVPDHGLFIPELFFLLIATTCLIASALLLFSCVISIATATIIPKTVFEVVYHLVAAVLLLLASIIYIVDIEGEYRNRYHGSPYNMRLAAGEMTFFSPLTFLLLVASSYYLGCISSRNTTYYRINKLEGATFSELAFGWKIFAGILGIINSLLYGVGVFFAHRSFKSG